jgi:hypothetical protein
MVAMVATAARTVGRMAAAMVADAVVATSAINL